VVTPPKSLSTSVSLTPFGHGLREYWSLDPAVTFLNHGSYGATPRYVQAVQTEWRTQMEAEPVRFMQDELPASYDAARNTLAKFVGAARENLVFVESATAGANAVLQSIDWQPGDKVVIANHGYPALKNTLRYLAGRYQLQVIEANVPWPIKDAGEVVHAYLAAIAGGARLLVVDHIFSPLAIETPLVEIAAACRAHGVKLLVDGAHSPVLLPLDIDSLFASGVDWYVGNCHKWLCAPKGAAFLAAAPHAQAGLHPTVISNFYGEGFQREFAWCGTGDFSAKLSVPAAIRFVAALGVARYREHLRLLARDAAMMIAAAWKVTLPAPLSMSHSMVTIPLPIDEAASAEGVARWRMTLLREHGIEAPIHPINGKLHVRISAQVYNEMSDYEKLARVFAG
jgi:isopenicillin-N epimerase